MPNYVVNPGDTLSEIARAHGVQDWRRIYEHPKNRALFEGRSPDLIRAGETIFIPEATAASRTGGWRWPVHRSNGIQFELRDPWHPVHDARNHAPRDPVPSEDEAAFLVDTWISEGWVDGYPIDTLLDLRRELDGEVWPLSGDDATLSLKRDLARALHSGRVVLVPLDPGAAAPLDTSLPAAPAAKEAPRTGGSSPDRQPAQQRSAATREPCDVQKLVVTATVLGAEPAVRRLTATRRLRGRPAPSGVSQEVAALLRSYDLVIDTVAAYPSKEEAAPEEKVKIEGRAEYHGGTCPEQEHPLLVLQPIGNVEELKGAPGGLSWNALSSEPREFCARGVAWDFNQFGGDLGILFRFISQFFREDSGKVLNLEARSCGRRAAAGGAPLQSLNALVRIFRNDSWEISLKLPAIGKVSHEYSRTRDLATGTKRRETETEWSAGRYSGEVSTKTKTASDGITTAKRTEAHYSGGAASSVTTGTKRSGAYVHGKQQGANGEGREFRRSTSGKRPEGDGWSEEGDGYGRLLPKDKQLKKPNSIELVVKCNDRKLKCVDAAEKILEAIKDVAETIEDALEALERLPQVGWKFTFSLSILAGSLKLSWGKEMIDEAVGDRYLPARTIYSLDAKLKIIDIEAEISFGFEADAGLGTRFVLKASGGIGCSVPLSASVSNSPDPFEVKLKPKLKCEFKATAEASLFGWSLVSAEVSFDGGITVDGKFIIDPGRTLRLTGKLKRNPTVFKGHFQSAVGSVRPFRREVFPAADLCSF
ncbi:LysM peptidoglycan-binding domain-containing protein [Sorangium sp. So ce1182]|uniref:LysM peptidoglycan-binding domain-containing protein n=1 Tax=Sorangium sp. So ce1182 TaxID=3133334 RepID=UPI003F635DDF